MCSWKASFKQAVTSYRAEKHEEAIAQFTHALELGGDVSTICDSRAAVYHKLGKVKEALRDSKTVIDLDPHRWQGYARSAHLFLHIRKFEAAKRMVSLALERVPSEHVSRRNDLDALRGKIHSAQEAAIKETTKLKSERGYHFGKLPVEIAHAIFSMTLAEDHAYVVILAQVCQPWRATILETPGFWSTLVLTNCQPVRKIKTWKKRSRNRIREIALLRNFIGLPAALDELKALSIEFLQTLRMQFVTVSDLRHHLPSVAPEIERSLRGCTVMPNIVRGELHRFQQSLTFQCKELDLFIITRVRPVWSELSDSLVDLESCRLSNALNGEDWPHLVWLLYRNPNLAHLDIARFAPTSFVPFPGREVPATIHMPHLADLNLTSSVPDQLLPLLTLPSLQSLYLASCRMPLTASLDYLAAGTASTLTTLAIHNAAFDPSRLLKTLAIATALESLHLRSVGNKAVNPVLEALARPRPAGAEDAPAQSQYSRVYCPSLRHLDCSQNPDVTGGPLVRLVKLRLEADTVQSQAETGIEHQVRTDPVQPLQSLIIDECQAVDPNVLPWLREKVAIVSCVYMSKKNAAWKR